MLHFSLPPHAARRAHQAAPPAMTPASYLALRRRAAGLSVAEAARRVSANNQEDFRALLCLLETPGATAKYRETIAAFQDAFPIDPDVYLQLRDAAPEAHPRICGGCGCSHWDPCVEAQGDATCAWHDAHTCTRCADAPAFPVHQ